MEGKHIGLPLQSFTIDFDVPEYSESSFAQIVAEAALDAGKTLRVLERRTQASDHPILLTVPETLYLKCLILEIVGQ